MTNASASLLVERKPGGVVELRLNRGAKRNALDRALVEHLHLAFDTLEAGADRTVVISSTDGRTFSAGADTSLAPAELVEVSDRLYGLYERMLASPSIVIAAVGGYAIGGGMQLALAADIRVGSADTEFRFVGAANHVVVGAWGLPALVGRARAVEILTRMKPIGSQEALAIGLLNTVGDDARATALEWAAQIATLDGGTLAEIKRVVLSATRALEPIALERTLNQGWPARLRDTREEASDT